MKLRLFRDRLPASTRGACCAAFAVLISPTLTLAASPQSVPATRSPTSAAPAASSKQATQPTVTPPGPPNQGIIYATSTPDSVLEVKTGAGVVTRISLPEEAKSAICGDLFDPTSNAGSFIITRDGNDVYVKPVPKTQAKSNLFVKTEKNVFNFDLVIVPPEQAHRVFNVNIPTYEKDIEAVKEQARKDLEAAYQQRTTELEATYSARLDQLNRENDGKLDEERKKIRTEAEGKANERVTMRLVDGLLHGFGPTPLGERNGKFGPVSVTLDSEAQTFEGMLYVRYRITNNTAEDVAYREPRVSLRALSDERTAPITATTFTEDGVLRVPAKGTTQGVIVFERPTLQRGDKVVLIFRGEDVEKMQLQLNILVLQ
jgi:hypothetical protein